jgi:hypothetical protein
MPAVFGICRIQDFVPTQNNDLANQCQIKVFFHGQNFLRIEVGLTHPLDSMIARSTPDDANHPARPRQVFGAGQSLRFDNGTPKYGLTPTIWGIFYEERTANYLIRTGGSVHL